MNAKQFIDKFGREEASAVADRAGTNIQYFVQIAYGHRRPSFDLAEKLVEASNQRLDLLLLLKSKKQQEAA